MRTFTSLIIFSIATVFLGCGNQNNGSKARNPVPSLFGNLPEGQTPEAEPIDHKLGPNDAVNLSEEERCKKLAEQIAFNSLTIVNIEKSKRAAIKSLASQGLDFFNNDSGLIEAIGNSWFEKRIESANAYYADNQTALDTIAATSSGTLSDSTTQQRILRDNNALIIESSNCD